MSGRYRIVEIGPGKGTILEVSGRAVAFIDAEGVRGSIQLPTPKDPNLDCFQYVANRKLDEPPWTVTFRDEQRTRFVFPSYASAYEDLIGPLRDVGHRTFDMT